MVLREPASFIGLLVQRSLAEAERDDLTLGGEAGPGSVSGEATPQIEK